MISSIQSEEKKYFLFSPVSGRISAWFESTAIAGQAAIEAGGARP